jgi:S-adenosylmethionine/arginine decarboxylase-like enzyme
MIDIFTCWDKADPFKAREFLLNYFRPLIIEKLLSLRRGDAE